MSDKFLYFLVDTLCLAFPFILSFHKRIRFYTQWRYFILPCFITSVIFIAWDIIFTAKGIWSFNSRYILGLYFAGLPIEELLFFFCIPYACVFTYYAIPILLKIQLGDRVANFVTILLATLLIIVGVSFITRLYTSVTFLLLASLLIILTKKRAKFLSRFYIAFLITLIPFYVSNGVLTGLFTPEPVVSYNNTHNLGIRTFTIPIEDIFYGMALLLMNISGFELKKCRSF